MQRTLLFLGAVVAVAADAPLAKEIERLRIPAKLTPREAKPLFLVRAQGAQIYRAEEKDGKLQWAFQGPRAVLLDYRTGEEVGKHGKGPNGPFWEDAEGKVVGKKPVSEPAPNPQAIPWLLLEGVGEGKGRFARVIAVQRVDTWGGQMPAAAPARAGEVREARYQATYIFSGAR
jgi:hypothetical protein